MRTQIIPFEKGEARLSWTELTEALANGHQLARAKVADTFLYRGTDTLLNRSAWIDGLGMAVKVATVFPGNSERNEPNINGGVNLFSDCDGRLDAVIDFHLVTKWKTAGDSLLGALRLARQGSRRILIIGAGTVARSLHAAYSAGFPDAEFTVWNRTTANAEALAKEIGANVADELADAVNRADIITSATMSKEPVIRGEWLQPGQHVDLIGAFRPDMREADDFALTKSRLFMDSRETVLGHIGELKIPIESGVVGSDDVIADYYDLTSGAFTRRSDDEITLFKNGGGAHLDLMTSRYILDKWNSQ